MGICYLKIILCLLVHVSSDVCCYTLHVFPTFTVDVNPSGVCILFEVNKREIYFFKEEANCDLLN